MTVVHGDVGLPLSPLNRSAVVHHLKERFCLRVRDAQTPREVVAEPFQAASFNSS